MKTAKSQRAEAKKVGGSELVHGNEHWVGVTEGTRKKTWADHRPCVSETRDGSKNGRVLKTIGEKSGVSGKHKLY